MEVLKQALEYNYNGLFIADIRKIQHSISIVPDFSSTLSMSTVLNTEVYDHYLLNHDADRTSWTLRKGATPSLTACVDWRYLDTPVEERAESEDEDGYSDAEDEV